jgi:hypothetical protein
MGILTGKWKYRDLVLVQTIQLAVYTAFSTFKVFRAQGAMDDKNVDEHVQRDFVRTRIKNALQRRVEDGSLFAFEVMYDPTVWQAKKLLLCELLLQPDASPGYWKLKLDFSKPVSEGVQILRGTGGGWIPIDVTQTAMEVEDENGNDNRS